METLGEELRISLTAKDADELENLVNGKINVIPPLFDVNPKDDLIDRIKQEATYRWEDIPNEKDIMTLRINLERNVVPPIVNGQKMVNLNAFRKARALASPAMQSVLSPEMFARLRKEFPRGRVPIQSIVLCVRKYVTLMHRACTLLQYATRGYLGVNEMTEYIESEVVNKMSYFDKDESDDSNSRTVPLYYTNMCLCKFFFFLDAPGHRRLRVEDVVASGFLDEMITQVYAEHDGDPANWFSIANCNRVLDMFREVDEDQNGLISLPELLKINRGIYTPSFITRVFAVEKTYEKGQLDFNGFVHFILAVENKKDPASLRWLFRVFDEDGDGFLGRTEIERHVRDMLDNLARASGQPPMAAFEDVADEIFDMTRPEHPERGVALADIVESGNGETVFGIMSNYNDFHMYETREDQAADNGEN